MSSENTSCGRCHTSASQLGRALLKCGACKIVLYCDKDCQRQDWRSHKPQCQQLQAGDEQPGRTRTTMQVNLADMIRERQSAATGPSNSASNRDGAGTIYFLKTSTPHIHDVSISGPYKDLAAVHAQALHNFGEECQPGRDTLQDFVRDGEPTAFVHISSPINNNPNRTKRISLIRKTNAHLAAKLPCRVWSVIVAEAATDTAMVPTGPNGDSLPMKDMEVRDSFESDAAATESARALVGQITAGGEYMSRVAQESPFVAGIANRRTKTLERFVSVTPDDGVVTTRE